MASEGPEGPLWCVAQGARLGGAPVIDWGVSGVEFRGCAVVDWQQLVGLIWQNLLDIGKPHACSEQSCQTHAKKKKKFFLYTSLIPCSCKSTATHSYQHMQYFCVSKQRHGCWVVVVFFCFFWGGIFNMQMLILLIVMWAVWSLCGLYDRYVGCMIVMWAVWMLYGTLLKAEPGSKIPLVHSGK